MIRVLFIFVIMFIIIAASRCVVVDNRVFNREDLQDMKCYNDFGGMHGYCDQ